MVTRVPILCFNVTDQESDDAEPELYVREFIFCDTYSDWVIGPLFEMYKST